MTGSIPGLLCEWANFEAPVKLASGAYVQINKYLIWPTVAFKFDQQHVFLGYIIPPFLEDYEKAITRLLGFKHIFLTSSAINMLQPVEPLLNSYADGATQTNSKKLSCDNVLRRIWQHLPGPTQQIRFCTSIIPRWCIAHRSDLRDLTHHFSGIASSAGEIGSTVIKTRNAIVPKIVPGEKAANQNIAVLDHVDWRQRATSIAGSDGWDTTDQRWTSPDFGPDHEYLIWFDGAIVSHQRDDDGYRKENTMQSTSSRFHKMDTTTLDEKKL
ncbi:hypothetical protein EDB87DRAFT_1580209 [Lactarius vividus]|nr:hypothetical protein EDB87DRAFT_1580209 [Lactarius vividus]